MPLDRQQVTLTINNQPVGKAPRCPGVYRFFSAQDVLLYVGKSIDIGARLNSHFNEARTGTKQQRMMAAVQRIDCQLTAGDAGAQFIENAAIKAESPLYNRRQKRTRKLWTQRLVENADGFLNLVPSDFSLSDERREPVFGLYRSRYHIDNALRELARDHKLCPRKLALEKGRGACFQHQVGRCLGACAGKETAEAHNIRLLSALDQQRIAAWPFANAVLLEEIATESLLDQQPSRQYHVLHHWSYLGTWPRRDQARRKAKSGHTLAFDRDSYRIALRALRDNQCRVIDADTGERLDNPFVSLLPTDPDAPEMVPTGS